MLSTVVRSLFPSASSEGSGGIPDFGGRWSPVIGGQSHRYATSSGEVISDASVLSIAAWFACIRNISEDIAKLPLSVYERDDDSREQKYNHPVARALRKPNPEMTAFSLRETWFSHALGFGDGYIEIAASPSSDTLEFYPLDPTCVTPMRDKGRFFYRYYDKETQTTIDFPPEKILHLHGLGGDGIRGYSLASIFRELLGTVMANLKVTGSIWRNGLFVGGVLQHPNSLGDDALKNLRQSFENRHGGSTNAGKLMILEEGMTFNQLAIDPERAQLIDQRQFDVEEVARVYRMPLHKIGHLLRSTFNNIEHQAREYVGDTLSPWAIRGEQEYDRKLLFAEEKLYTKHNFMGMLRGDESARAEYYTKMLQMGMTPNKILALEDMPGIGTEGDISYITMQVRPQTPEARKAAMEKPAAPVQPLQEMNKPKPGIDEDKGGRPKNSMASAYIEAIETILEPLARKEVNAVSRAAQKHFDDRAKFLNVVQKFHIEHAEQLRIAMEPAVGALVAMLDGEREDPRIDVQVRAYIAMSTDAKVAQITVCDFPQGVERTMETWMTRELNKSANDLASMALGLAERMAA